LPGSPPPNLESENPMEVTTTALTAAIGKFTDAINAQTSAVQANTQALNALPRSSKRSRKNFNP